MSFFLCFWLLVVLTHIAINAFELCFASNIASCVRRTGLINTNYNVLILLFAKKGNIQHNAVLTFAKCPLLARTGGLYTLAAMGAAYPDLDFCRGFKNGGTSQRTDPTSLYVGGINYTNASIYYILSRYNYHFFFFITVYTINSNERLKIGHCDGFFTVVIHQSILDMVLSQGIEISMLAML
ncbi:hypothetical protein ACJX0J_014573, partial [Zea mays]